MNSTIKEIEQSVKGKLLSYLSNARRVALCLDIWSKKGLTASFLGVSVCMFNSASKECEHFMLNLHVIQHPHTGDMIASKIMETLKEWNIQPSKVLIVITDNGTNMVKALKTTFSDFDESESLNEDTQSIDANVDMDENEMHDLVTESDEDRDFESIFDAAINPIENREGVKLRRLPCFPHTIQLVVNQGTKSDHVASILSAARGIVTKIRKSSVAIEELLKRAGKTVIDDCPTRWSSTYLMLERLLELKNHLKEVLDVMKWDNLVASEWMKVEQLMKILHPFAEHTKLLESNKITLSSAIPAILDLECHLEMFIDDDDDEMSLSLKAVGRVLLNALKQKFEFLLKPTSKDFEPIAAAACLLDPQNVHALFVTGYEPLRVAAKSFISELTFADGENVRTGSTAVQRGAVMSESLKRFKYLSQQLNSAIANNRQAAGAAVTGVTSEGGGTVSRSLADELRDYEGTIQSINVEHSVQWWVANEHRYPILSPIAEDLLAMPASEAYVERIFSICGDLSKGKRNRAKDSLQRLAFLKLNKKFW